MARPKKPTNLKVLQGTAQKCRINKKEPKPEIKIPNPPDNLLGFALDEWNRITPILERLGLISECDVIALAMYCDSVKTWREADAQLYTEGLTIETTNGNVIQNPLVGIKNTAMQLAHKFLTQFGLSPASRSGVTSKVQQPENPLAKFKRRVNG